MPKSYLWRVLLFLNNLVLFGRRRYKEYKIFKISVTFTNTTHLHWSLICCGLWILWWRSGWIFGFWINVVACCTLQLNHNVLLNKCGIEIFGFTSRFSTSYSDAQPTITALKPSPTTRSYRITHVNWIVLPNSTFNILIPHEGFRMLSVKSVIKQWV